MTGQKLKGIVLRKSDLSVFLASDKEAGKGEAVFILEEKWLMQFDNKELCYHLHYGGINCNFTQAWGKEVNMGTHTSAII